MTDAAETTPAVGLETAREVVRLSELYLEGTLRLSLAADTRALQITNMLAGAATLLLGLGLVNVLDQTNLARIALGAASLCGGVLFLTALLFSARTIRPREFNIVGTLRSNWSDKDLKGDLAQVLIDLSTLYETQARENIATLSHNAKHVKIASPFLLPQSLCRRRSVCLHTVCWFSAGKWRIPMRITMPPKPIQEPIKPGK
jgi:hypothetical protein